MLVVLVVVAVLWVLAGAVIISHTNTPSDVVTMQFTTDQILRNSDEPIRKNF